MSNCPYCGGELKEGFIHGDGGRAVFWLPQDRLRGMTVYTKKGIERRGGFVIDSTRKLLLAKKRPVSCYCEKCGLLITALSFNSEEDDGL